MTTTPTTTTKTTPKTHRDPKWRLRVIYWTEDKPSGYGVSVGIKDGRGNIQRETFAAGRSKAETLLNWYFQYYRGQLPESPRIPKDAITIEWSRWTDVYPIKKSLSYQ